jgi:hypothetical protein
MTVVKFASRAALLSLMLALIGCGGGGSSGSTPPVEMSPPPPPPPPPPEEDPSPEILQPFRD